VLARLRRKQILEELQAKGGVRLAELSETLVVSEMTVRRDLDALEREGLIERAVSYTHLDVYKRQRQWPRRSAPTGHRRGWQGRRRSARAQRVAAAGIPGHGRGGASMIRLLLADDQELVRTALAALLTLEEDFEVVATVGRGDEVVAAAKAHRPDVALLDIQMPGIDGLAAAAVLAQELPECRSLILTTFGRPGYLRRAMESGARGFVVKLSLIHI